MRSRPHSRSISSLKSERKRMKDKELMMENFKQLERLQNAKASFNVVNWDKAEKKRQKLIGNMKLYPEPPIAEVVKKPSMNKRGGIPLPNNRHPTVDPRVSPRGSSKGNNRFPTLQA